MHAQRLTGATGEGFAYIKGNCFCPKTYLEILPQSNSVHLAQHGRLHPIRRYFQFQARAFLRHPNLCLIHTKKTETWLTAVLQLGN